jgi:hypothetical protein
MALYRLYLSDYPFDICKKLSYAIISLTVPFSGSCINERIENRHDFARKGATDMALNLFELDRVSIHPLIDNLHYEFRQSRVLHVAAKLDIFTRLTNSPATSNEVAKGCGADPIMTEKLLICCCAMGLLKKIDNRYANTQVAQTYLARGMPLYQGHMIAHADRLWDFWTKLEAVVYTGSREAAPDAAPTAPQDDRHRDFICAMHNISVCGDAQMTANNVDLSGCKRLLDVGGGPGTYSIALCQKYPNLTAVVFDRPDTLAITREFIAQFQMEGRILLEEGDWNQERYGDDYEAVLFSNVLHGSTSGALDKLRKGYAALNNGGHLIVHDFLLNNEKTGPLGAALFNMMIGAYSIREMLEVISAAGFVGGQLVAVGHRGNGLMTAFKREG